MESVKIVLLAVVGAVAYGIVHDQVTVRLCVEYFTVFHPPVFSTQDPTLLAVGWGVLATWWVGAVLGVGLALAARAGSRPPLPARMFVRPVVTLLAVMGVCAVVAWQVGALLARQGLIVVVSPWAGRVPRDRHLAFLGDLWAHNASYLVGFVGGIVLMVRSWRHRRPGASPAAAGTWTRADLPTTSAFLAGRGPVHPVAGVVTDRVQVYWRRPDDLRTDAAAHAHTASDELFVVLAGAIVFEVGGAEHAVGPRQVAHFPVGCLHRIVRVDGKVEALVVRAPSIDDKRGVRSP